MKKFFLFLFTSLFILTSCKNNIENSIPTTPIDTTPPARIKNLTTEIGNKSVSFSWTNPEDKDFYGTKITFTPIAQKVSQPIIVQGNPSESTTITIYELINDIEYTFILTALDNNKNESTETIIKISSRKNDEVTQADDDTTKTPETEKPDITIDDTTDIQPNNSSKRYELEINNANQFDFSNYTGEVELIISGENNDKVNWRLLAEKIRITTNATIRNLDLTGVTGLFDFEDLFNGLNLYSIGIPNGYTNFAFDRCTSLTNLYVSSENEKFASENGLIYSKDFAILYYCPPAKTGELLISDKCKEIASCSFSECKKNLSVIIPKSVIFIRNKAFPSYNTIHLIFEEDAWHDLLGNIITGTTISPLLNKADFDYYIYTENSKKVCGKVYLDYNTNLSCTLTGAQKINKYADNDFFLVDFTQKDISDGMINLSIRNIAIKSADLYIETNDKLIHGFEGISGTISIKYSDLPTLDECKSKSSYEKVIPSGKSLNGSDLYIGGYICPLYLIVKDIYGDEHKIKLSDIDANNTLYLQYHGIPSFDKNKIEISYTPEKYEGEISPTLIPTDNTGIIHVSNDSSVKITVNILKDSSIPLSNQCTDFELLDNIDRRYLGSCKVNPNGSLISFLYIATSDDFYYDTIIDSSGNKHSIVTIDNNGRQFIELQLVGRNPYAWIKQCITFEIQKDE